MPILGGLRAISKNRLGIRATLNGCAGKSEAGVVVAECSAPGSARTNRVIVRGRTGRGPVHPFGSLAATDLAGPGEVKGPWLCVTRFPWFCPFEEERFGAAG